MTLLTPLHLILLLPYYPIPQKNKVRLITVSLLFAILAPISTHDITELVAPLITQILQDQIKENICKTVSVINEIPDGAYEAVSNLDDGTSIKIAIQFENGMLYV
jgi:hypothetical protein|tara:strand:+ start:138 stop:452 length:315 start_codon:yes stop_codon:yes gene_type:complete